MTFVAKKKRCGWIKSKVKIKVEKNDLLTGYLTLSHNMIHIVTVYRNKGSQCCIGSVCIFKRDRNIDQIIADN